MALSQQLLTVWFLIVQCFVSKTLSLNCDQERNKCVFPLLSTLDENYRNPIENVNELVEHCGKLKQEGNCLGTFSDDCLKKYKEISVLKESLEEFDKRFCDQNASDKKLFESKIGCVRDNDRSLQDCGGLNVPERNSSEEECKMALKSVECAANKIKSACQEDGEKLWGHIQEPRTDYIKFFCLSGGVALKFTFSVLMLAVISHFIGDKLL